MVGAWKATEAQATYCLPSGTLYLDLFRKSGTGNNAYWGLGLRVLMKNSALLKAITSGVSAATGLTGPQLQLLCKVGTPLKTFFRTLFAAQGALVQVLSAAEATLPILQKAIMDLYVLVQEKITEFATKIKDAAAQIAQAEIKKVAENIGKEIAKNFPGVTLGGWGSKTLKAVKILAKAMASTLQAALPISVSTTTDTYTGMDFEMGENAQKDKITFFTNTILGLTVGATVTPGVGIKVQGYYAFGN